MYYTKYLSPALFLKMQRLHVHLVKYRATLPFLGKLTLVLPAPLFPIGMPSVEDMQLSQLRSRLCFAG
jgi:hypothetical protein